MPDKQPIRGNPSSNFYAVTPHDTTVLPKGRCRALYIGVSGDVTCLNDAADAILFKAVPVGILYIGTTRVNNTATTATNILALY